MAKATTPNTKPPKKSARPRKPVPSAVTTVEPRKVGRPSLYSEETATRICTEIALGKSLMSICSADDMPDRVTVWRWLEEHIEFRNEYARARELQADHYADQIVDLADAAEDANLARLQIDARKWTAAKLRPSRYSERLLNEHTGKDGAPIAVKQITPGMTLQEATEAYADMLKEHPFPGSTPEK
jgi:hypothetical protein